MSFTKLEIQEFILDHKSSTKLNGIIICSRCEGCGDEPGDLPNQAKKICPKCKGKGRIMRFVEVIVKEKSI